MSDQLESRGKALENAFFREREKVLLERLKAQSVKADQLHALAEVSGIEDPNILNQMMELGLTSSSIVAFSLAPLVEVAWADSTLDSKERDAILEACRQVGLKENTIGFQLIQSWTEAKPNPKILDVWANYTREIAKSLKSTVVQEMKISILSRATSIARVSGGILGLGNKISDSEQKILSEIEAAFSS